MIKLFKREPVFDLTGHLRDNEVQQFNLKAHVGERQIYVVLSKTCNRLRKKAARDELLG